MFALSELRIKKVWVDDAFCDSQGRGMMLDVVFANGSGIHLLLDSKADEPLFCDVALNKCGAPITDGERIYWQNGATLTICEMLEMVQVQTKPKSDLRQEDSLS